ncbi:MAG: hypothetical protein RMM98_11660 [Acidobacteriota bacterium]|nr:hypothetical protein [Blastocatellia bacterium]MDW8240264.1 hypothetical protein [Acidobacteriota bacterium]
MSNRRAFVLQFQSDADLQQGQWEGRSEHVSSGRVMHFHSLQEMLGFFCEMVQEENSKLAQEEWTDAHQA